MTLGHRIRAVVVAAAVATATPRAGAAPDSTQPTTQAALLSTRQIFLQYIDRLSTALSQGSQTQRDEAAQRLVAIGLFETRSVISRVLSGSDEKAQTACAAAIAEGPSVDRDWVPSLVQMLFKDRTVEVAARALTRYEENPVAFEPLIRLAQSRQQLYRTSIIRSLGQFVQKPVAQTLIAIVADPTEDTTTQTTAADALAELSGQTANGHDPRRWNTWWNARSARNAPDWRLLVLSEQHPALEHDAIRNRDEIKQFRASVRDLLLNQYTHQPPADKAKTLLGFLNNSNAGVREIGASIVPEAVGSGQPITEDIHNRLIELVSDASANVRLQAVQALKRLADPNALDAVLTQLQVENDDELKIVLLKTVAVPGVGTARALPVVRQMLEDSSPRVAAEAAATIAALAPTFETDPIEAKSQFDFLHQTLQTRTGLPGQPNDEPDGTELRAALVNAMARLAKSNPSVALDDFTRMVTPDEQAPTRRAALLGLAVLGESSGAGDVIARELDPNVEPDPSVRQAAASALGEIGSMNYAKQLDASSRPQSEPEKLVRDAAFKAFQVLLASPSSQTRELSQWADLFDRRKEFDREVIVLKTLCQKLGAAGDLQNLAVEQQRTGEVYLQLNQPADAVPYLRQALAYWEGAHAKPLTMVNLIHEMMRALLESGQGHEAVKFGEQEIHRNPDNELEVAPALRNAVELLLQKGDPASYKEAAALVDDALNMNPPLHDIYVDQLKDQRNRIPAVITNPG